MKKSIFGKIMFFTLLSLFATLSSCKKDKTKSLELEINYKVNNDVFAYDQVYTIGGKAVKFSLAQFYISGISVENDALEVFDYEDYLLIKPTQTKYTLGVIGNQNIDHLHHVKFNVGIDSATNSQTTNAFNSRTSPDPLAIQNPAMHWSWNTGYIFVKIDCTVDTDGDGTPETTGALHLGMNSMFQAIDLTAHSDLEKGTNTVKMNFNIAKLFDGIDLSTEFSTHTMV